MAISLHAVHKADDAGKPVTIEINHTLGTNRATWKITHLDRSKVTNTETETVIKAVMTAAEMEDMVKTLQMILNEDHRY